MVLTMNDSFSGPQPNLSASTELFSTATALKEGMLVAWQPLPGPGDSTGISDFQQTGSRHDLFCLPGLATSF